MTRILPPLVLAAGAAAGFAWVVTTFQCCDGKEGFARNVATFTYVALGLFLIALFAFRPAKQEWVRSGLRVLALWTVATGIVLLARPPWDLFVRGAELGLAWRTLTVFAATVLSSALVARLFRRR